MKTIKKTPGRIGLNKRIKMKCLECSGSGKEITLCHQFDCPLWSVRFGHPQNNKQYRERMEVAQNHYHKDFEELKGMGIDIADFFKEHAIQVKSG